jgi:hypothetical protein
MGQSILSEFPWLTWLAAASNVVMMLAAEHWFPWSFHLGYKLPRYLAFVAGCIAILFSFGLWALMESMLLSWLVFTAALLLLHWPGWLVPWVNRINYILAYVITSLPALAVFGAWAFWAGEMTAFWGVFGLYIVGGVATIAANILDKLGISENFERINHQR